MAEASALTELKNQIKQQEKEIIGLKAEINLIKKCEEESRLMTEITFEGLMICENRKLIRANEYLFRMFGYEPHELIGKDVVTIIFHPDSVEVVERKMGISSEDHFEAMGIKKDGTSFPIEIHIEKGEYYDQIVNLYAIRDVTQHKRMEDELTIAYLSLDERVKERTADLLQANTELEQEIEQRLDAEVMLRKVNRALKALSDCNRILVHTVNEDELLNEVCRIIVEEGGYRLAWVGFAEENEAKDVKPVAQAGYENGYLGGIRISWSDSKYGRGPTGTAIRTGEPTVAHEIPTDKNFSPWRKQALKRGFTSSIAIPLSNEGKTFGALNIYSTEPDAFDTSEVDLLVNLADNLAYGIMALRVRKERERAKEGLEAERKRFFSVLEGLPAFIYLQGPNYDVHFANRYFREHFGIPDGRTCYEIVHHRSEPCEMCRTMSIFDTKKPRIWEWYSDREDRTYEIYNYPFHDIDGTFYVLKLGIDITDRKKSEQEVRRLSAKILNAQEEERKYIALELHDGLGQELSAVKFKLEHILKDMEGDAHLNCMLSLEGLVPLVQEAIVEVRRLQRDLRPSILDDLGILATISWILREFESVHTDIQLDRCIKIQESDVPDSLKIVIYRILREALNNVAKHSQASKVRVLLNNNGHSLELLIKDNGIGFDAQEIDSKKWTYRGLGLVGMNERASLSGGSYFIDTNRGKGTTIRILWPLRPTE
jgi:PAS domain S-box-containing protein